MILAASVLSAPAYTAPAKEKEALQALNEFVGDWKGHGSPSKAKPDSKELWDESVSWGWKFGKEDKDVALSITFKDGKYFKSGVLRYILVKPDKYQYQLTVKDADDKELVFLGDLDKENNLVMERKDEDKKITQQLTMSSAAQGDRFLYSTKNKKEGSTIYTKDFEVNCTREGVTLGPKEKKNECVVSGGKGTIAVTYKGETFYVCCTGCRDAFNDNPEKYIKEYKARKKNQ
jgi:YHS domain-containing protein